MEEEKKEKVDNALLPIAQKEQEEVLKNLIKANNTDKVKDLTNLFNLNQIKIRAVQLNALNSVQDALIRQMAERLAKTPDNFNNTDIANWMKVVQQASDLSQKSIEQINNMPTIVHQQNTQVNVNITDSLSKDSREKILDAIKAITNLAVSSENIQEGSPSDVSMSDDLEDEELFENQEDKEIEDNNV